MSDRARNSGSSTRTSGSAPNSSNRPSGGGSASRGKNERNDRRGTPSSERPHHRSSDQNSSSGGGQQRGHGGGGGGGGRAMSMLSGQAFSENELMTDLPKKKFTGRCRLFVGNLPNDLKEEELKELFSPHGDIAECYLSGKGFAFLRMDTRAHAESAKEAIDGKMIHNRPVRVRFAVHGAALRVKELSATVSNEMLYHAFSAFGEVERAVHIVDEKGRPTGEGIVEFERKPSANEALHQIRDKVFLLTSSPKPLVVEMLEPRDEDDGLAERMIPRNAQLQKERELGPRFPPSNSFEFVFGQKWKELYEVERQRRAQLEEELKEARRRLDADMELAYQDYQTQMLREDLARRQQELERLEEAKRQRMAQVAARRGEMPTSILGNVGTAPPQSVGAPPPGVTSGGPPRGEFFGAGGTTTGGAPPPPRGPFGGPGPDMIRGPAPDVLSRAPPDMMARGGPPMDGPMSRNMGPPFQQGPPGAGGQRGPGGPGGPGVPGMADPTLVQGVQKLLQIFRTDTPGGGAPRPMQPPQGFGGPGYGGPGGPGPMGPGGPQFGGGPGGPPGGFHRGPPMTDFQPSEKRIRR
uniref:Paraspeckle component 1 n=2 Tax=Ascaris suum TaxID=6253 RepID=F1KUA6_ASCSU